MCRVLVRVGDVEKMIDPYRMTIIKIIGWILGVLMTLLYLLRWYQTGSFW